jgi:hypothetical protein
MSPLVAKLLARERANFNGEISVIEDQGTKLIVLVVPPATDEEDAVPSDWAKRTKPFLMLLDETREHGKFISEYTIQ